MDPLPSLQELLSTLSLGVWVLAAFGLALVFYGYVADRVIFEGGGRLHTEKLGPVDVLVAAVLTGLFSWYVLFAILSSGSGVQSPLPDANTMIEAVLLNALVDAVIVGGILGGLTARSIPWREVFGLNRVGPGAVLVYAVLLLVAALPLINDTTILSNLLLAAGGRVESPDQELVRFLRQSGSHAARDVVAVSAVVIAPVVEEFIFRGCLYGVMRRYGGVAAGIVFNAALFAAIHTHLPSFGGLFVLAVCLTLAYEWTGSIFVPITMHALFNSLSVVALLQSGANP